MKENDKKIFIVGVVVIVVLMLISFSIKDKNYEEKTTSSSKEVEQIMANAEKESEAAKEKELDELPNISLDDYMEIYKGTTPRVVLIASPTCHYCQIAEPIIRDIVTDTKIEVNYLDSSKFTEEDYDRFTATNEFFENGFGTPLMLIVGNEEIIDKVDGMTDKSHYLEFFNNNNLLPYE